jgi:hypothetical protein
MPFKRYTAAMSLRITLLALLFLLGGQGSVLASTGLTIQPVKISQTLNPGQEATGAILLTNASEEDVLVELKVEDFVPTAGAEGIQFVGRAEGVTTVRDWITLGDGESSFVFKQGEQREIPYRILAPEDAEPGSHFGVAFFKASKLAEDTSQLKVGTQVGVLIFVTVPGDFLQKGQIQDLSAPAFTQSNVVPFTIRFENTGTVHFEPKGLITIRNVFGKVVGTVPIEGQVVLPTGVKDLRFAWQTEGLLLGRYVATAAVKDGEGNELTSETVSFYAAPLWYILAFFVFIFLVYLLIRFLKSHVRISFSADAPAERNEDE